MLRDKFIKSIAKSEHLINLENDNIPVGMRGELEVIVKDRKGNILSYECGHNQVTNLAKMQIIHLLAGEIGIINDQIYSCANVANKRSFTKTLNNDNYKVVNYFDISSSSHSATTNIQGVLLSNAQYFEPATTPEIEQSGVNLNTSGIRANYPTKMLFGTGNEARDSNTTLSVYNAEIADGVNSATWPLINKLNGFTSGVAADANFFSLLSSSNANYYLNYYSGDEYFNRTLQPATVSPIKISPTATDTAIVGAIKDCCISYTSSDSSKYNQTEKMAVGEYRGYGKPAFIYTKRKTGGFEGTAASGFYDYKDTNRYINYGINTDSPATSDYETAVTYCVSMPTQPANIETVAGFYPYNGWILKQAGLFSDARYNTFSKGSTNENALMTAGENGNAIYNNSAAGMLLFKRNLASPVIKTSDVSIDFNWHVYITI